MWHVEYVKVNEPYVVLAVHDSAVYHSSLSPGVASDDASAEELVSSLQLTEAVAGSLSPDLQLKVSAPPPPRLRRHHHPVAASLDD